MKCIAKENTIIMKENQLFCLSAYDQHIKNNSDFHMKFTIKIHILKLFYEH